MGDQIENFDIVFDGQKFVYSLQIVLSTAGAIALVCLERVKNFEKFNFDTNQRDKLLVLLVFL